MSKRLHVVDSKLAREYKEALRSEGLAVREGRDREGRFVEIVGRRQPDIKETTELARELEDRDERLEAIREASGAKGSPAMRALRTIKGDFGRIAKGFTEPDKGKPKIARLPGRRSDIPIANASFRTPLAPKGAGIRMRSISLAPYYKRKLEDK